MITLNLKKEAAAELFDFIREHLTVVNDLQYVETVMIELEDKLDE